MKTERKWAADSFLPKCSPYTMARIEIFFPKIIMPNFNNMVSNGPSSGFYYYSINPFGQQWKFKAAIIELHPVFLLRNSTVNQQSLRSIYNVIMMKTIFW